MAKANIEDAIQKAISGGKINGAIICASDSAGSFEYNKAFGERTLLSGEKLAQELDDVLSLASATKLLTTIAALQCVEDGLLSLTGDLFAIAPELASKQVLKGFSDDDASNGGVIPILEPQTRPITLEMLLTHSSGIAYHFINPQIARWRDNFGRAGAQEKLEEKDRQPLAVEETFDYPLAFQPGGGWMYGPGLDWAGRIVERVTGKTLDDYLNERVFAPLGVAGEAQFYPVTDSALRARLVDLNPDDPHGVGLAVMGSATGGDHHKRGKGAFGGHGLFTTAPAYMKVLCSLLANDGKILKPTSVDTMLEQHLSPEATASHRDLLNGPMGVFFRVGTTPGTNVGHGLSGLLTLEDVEGMFGERTLIWGGGRTFAWFLDRKNDLCGVGAIQARLPFDGPTVEALKDDFRKDMYQIRRDSAVGEED